MRLLDDASPSRKITVKRALENGDFTFLLNFKNRKSDDNGKSSAIKNEKKVGLSDEEWKKESEKLTALVTEAKQFLETFDSKYSTNPRPNGIPVGALDEVLSEFEVIQSKARNGLESEEQDEFVGVDRIAIAENINARKTMDRKHKRRNPRRSSVKSKEVCVLDDVSEGKENVPIRVMNGIDDDKPLSFIYIAKIAYPTWFRLIKPTRCNCVGGCSDSKKCPCVSKNGGEIQFNEKGALIKAKPIVYECSPFCKCPPSCMNRVSQNGPKLELEIFKTKDRGWGVRSRNFISSGTFICEYIGELLRNTEAEQRVGDDEYLFDIGDTDNDEEEQGFAIDAAKFGNIGRFINHSCTPNLFAQEVLYDHDDKRMPHVMLFSGRSILPLQELTYDYNYKMGRVLDANGNVRTKACHCGSHECSGRMY